MTNAHVVEQASRVVVAFENIIFQAEVLVEDHDLDLALLRIPHGPTAWATFRPSVRLGEDIAAFGFREAIC